MDWVYPVNFKSESVVLIYCLPPRKAVSNEVSSGKMSGENTADSGQRKKVPCKNEHDQVNDRSCKSAFIKCLDIFADVVIVIFGHIKILFSNKK